MSVQDCRLRLTPYKAKTRLSQNSTFAKLEHFHIIQRQNSTFAKLDFRKTRDFLDNLDPLENEVTDFYLDFGQSRYSLNFHKMIYQNITLTHYSDVITHRSYCARRKLLKLVLVKRFCCSRYRIVGRTRNAHRHRQYVIDKINNMSDEIFKKHYRCAESFMCFYHTDIIIDYKKTISTLYLTRYLHLFLRMIPRNSVQGVLDHVSMLLLNLLLLYVCWLVEATWILRSGMRYLRTMYSRTSTNA